MAKKEMKRANLVVKSKVHGFVKSSGLRTGGDFYVALSDKMYALIQASIQKVEADGKEKTLNAVDLA